MAQHTWDVFVDGNRHVVELEHGYWSGRRLIRVDGQEVVNWKPKFGIDFGSAYPVAVASKTGIVLIQTNGFKFRYDLIIDGVSQATGEKVPETVPLYDPWWGKRPPKWIGGHLSPLEDSLMASAMGAVLVGFLYLTLPGPMLKGIGAVLVALSPIAYFIRRRNIFLVFALAHFAAGIIPAVIYPPVWKFFILMAAVGIWDLSLYRKNPSSTRPTD
jgi:hypothetical protein